MNARERVTRTLNHQEPDRIPFDLGGSSVTGMHVSTVYRLRQALGLDSPGTPVKVTRPYLMLGEIKADLVEALGIDVVPLGVDEAFRPPSDDAIRQAKIQYGLPERFFLYVGTLEPRKNLQRLIAAWSRTVDETDHDLVVAGRQQDEGRAAGRQPDVGCDCEGHSVLDHRQ